MINKIIIAMVVFCCSFSSIKAQTNNIYTEFLGLGLLGSVNYERMVKDNIFARVSYGGFSVSADGGFLMYYTSLGLRYQNPEGGLTFKVGISPIIASVDGETGTVTMPHLALGYSF